MCLETVLHGGLAFNFVNRSFGCLCSGLFFKFISIVNSCRRQSDSRANGQVYLYQQLWKIRAGFSLQSKGRNLLPITKIWILKAQGFFPISQCTMCAGISGPAQVALEQEYADILATPIIINLCASHPGVLPFLPVLMRL